MALDLIAYLAQIGLSAELLRKATPGNDDTIQTTIENDYSCSDTLCKLPISLEDTSICKSAGQNDQTLVTVSQVLSESSRADDVAPMSYTYTGVPDVEMSPSHERHSLEHSSIVPSRISSSGQIITTLSNITHRKDTSELVQSFSDKKDCVLDIFELPPTNLGKIPSANLMKRDQIDVYPKDIYLEGSSGSRDSDVHTSKLKCEKTTASEILSSEQDGGAVVSTQIEETHYPFTSIREDNLTSDDEAPNKISTTLPLRNISDTDVLLANNQDFYGDYMVLPVDIANSTDCVVFHVDGMESQGKSAHTTANLGQFICEIGDSSSDTTCDPLSDIDTNPSSFAVQQSQSSLAHDMHVNTSYTDEVRFETCCKVPTQAKSELLQEVHTDEKLAIDVHRGRLKHEYESVTVEIEEQSPQGSSALTLNLPAVSQRAKDVPIPSASAFVQNQSVAITLDTDDANVVDNLGKHSEAVDADQHNTFQPVVNQYNKNAARNTNYVSIVRFGDKSSSLSKSTALSDISNFPESALKHNFHIDRAQGRKSVSFSNELLRFEPGSDFNHELSIPIYEPSYVAIRTPNYNRPFFGPDYDESSLDDIPEENEDFFDEFFSDQDQHDFSQDSSTDDGLHENKEDYRQLRFTNLPSSFGHTTVLVTSENFRSGAIIGHMNEKAIGAVPSLNPGTGDVTPSLRSKVKIDFLNRIVNSNSKPEEPVNMGSVGESMGRASMVSSYRFTGMWSVNKTPLEVNEFADPIAQVGLPDMQEQKADTNIKLGHSNKKRRIVLAVISVSCAIVIGLAIGLTVHFCL